MSTYQEKPPSKGSVKFNSQNELVIKRDNSAGKFMDFKQDNTPFQNERREKAMDVIRKLKDK